MSEVLKMRTSLPGMPDVRIWLDIDWIVVRYGEFVSYQRSPELSAEESSAMAAALAEAAT